MDRRSKTSVGFILCLAASACICSMIRFQYVDGLTQIDDFFWNATNIAIWSTIECGASIIAGCLATLRPLLKRLFAKAGSITKSLRSSNTQSNGSSRQADHSADTSMGSASNTRKTENSSTDKPTFAEFIAERGEIIEMSSDTGGGRESQDRILCEHEEPTLDFPGQSRSSKVKTTQSAPRPCTQSTDVQLPALVIAPHVLYPHRPHLAYLRWARHTPESTPETLPHKLHRESKPEKHSGFQPTHPGTTTTLGRCHASLVAVNQRTGRAAQPSNKRWSPGQLSKGHNTPTRSISCREKSLRC